MHHSGGSRSRTLIIEAISSQSLNGGGGEDEDGGGGEAEGGGGEDDGGGGEDDGGGGDDDGGGGDDDGGGGDDADSPADVAQTHPFIKLQAASEPPANNMRFPLE